MPIWPPVDTLSEENDQKPFQCPENCILAPVHNLHQKWPAFPPTQSDAFLCVTDVWKEHKQISNERLSEERTPKPWTFLKWAVGMWKLHLEKKMQDSTRSKAA